MEKIYEKLTKIKNVLKEKDNIKKKKRISNEIMQDKELLNQIEKYNYINDERTKQEIINNHKFREYKHQEAELNLLILEINQQLKQITKKDKCGL